MKPVVLGGPLPERKETSLTERWWRRSGTREEEGETFNVAAAVSNDDSALACKHRPKHYPTSCQPGCCHGYLLFATPINTRSNSSQLVVPIFTIGRGVSPTGPPTQTMHTSLKIFHLVDFFCLVCMTRMKRHTRNVSPSQKEQRLCERTPWALVLHLFIHCAWRKWVSSSMFKRFLEWNNLLVQWYMSFLSDKYRSHVFTFPPGPVYLNQGLQYVSCYDPSIHIIVQVTSRWHLLMCLC